MSIVINYLLLFSFNFRILKEQYNLVEKFFIAFCQTVCLFIFLQATMALCKKFDPELTNIFYCFAYNLSHYTCISVTFLMLLGTYARIMAFIVKQFSSNCIRIGAFILTTSLVIVIFSTFCVIEYFFNSRWLNAVRDKI